MKGRKIRLCHNKYMFPFNTISANSAPPAEKGKEEEEGREKTDRKWKNVTGDGKVFGGFMNPSVCTFRDAHFYANTFQVPDPSQVTVMATQRLIAVWLSEGLLRSSINTALTVWDSDIRDVCWRAHRLTGAAFVMRRLETEAHFLWRKHCCRTQWTCLGAGAIWNQANLRPFLNVITVSNIVIWYSVVFKGGLTCLESVFINTVERTVFNLQFFKVLSSFFFF